MKLEDLNVYQLSLTLSNLAWNLYIKFNWDIKKVMGDQFIRSTDSVGSNIAEGFGRYYFLDKIRFYYNSRGSLTETQHWVTLLQVRSLISEEDRKLLHDLLKDISIKLNNLISATYRNKKNF